MSKFKITALILGIICQTSVVHATEIRDYFANSSMITWYENDNTDQTQGTSNKLTYNEDLVFTGTTKVQNKKEVTFSAPNIKMKSLIGIHSAEGNSITFENTKVNFDDANWATNSGARLHLS